MQVVFRRHPEHRVVQWEVVSRSRRNRPRCTMALGRGDLPHDLEQLVAEAALGIDRGFWGTVARGGTFRSMGNRRTAAGRSVVAANRGVLTGVEHLVHTHVALAEQGRPTPVAEPLARFRALWAAAGDRPLTVEWPTLRVVD